MEVHVLTASDDEETRVIGVYESVQAAKTAAQQRFALTSQWLGPTVVTYAKCDAAHNWMPETVWVRLSSTDGQYWRPETVWARLSSTDTHGQWATTAELILELFPVTVG